MTRQPDARRPDVTVIGAGVFGLACAWEMARRGAAVLVIERTRVGAGASGGVVGALAPHAPERWTPLKAFQLESLLSAGDFWAGVRDAGGTDPGYARSGRLQPVPDDDALMRARDRGASAADLWQGRAAWRIVRASEVTGWAPHSPTGWLIEDTLSARIQPAQACAALAAGLRARGATVEEGRAVPDAALAERAQGGPVLWATGADGLAALSAGARREVGRGVKGQAAVLALDRRDQPQIYADGLHIVPHADGTIAVGSTTERDFANPQTTDARLDAVLDRARAAVPALTGARVIRRWAGLRPRARSRAPILGDWPGRAGHYVANGGFKVGFGLAPGVARVMADLLLDGREDVPEGCRIEDSL